MAKILKLEEMLEAIGVSYKETRLMSTSAAFEHVKKKSANFFYHILPDEELEKLGLRKGFFDTIVYECLFNAVRSGHKFKPGIIKLKLHRGEKGLAVEVQDEGEGMPAYVPAMMKEEIYAGGFLRDNGGRGRGFHLIRASLDDDIFDAVGFNEKGNAIYLMALYK